MRGTDLRGIRRAEDGFLLRACQLGRRVAARRIDARVALDELREVHPAAKLERNAQRVDAKAIGRDLKAVRGRVIQLIQEQVAALGVALADLMGQHELRVTLDRNPLPAMAFIADVSGTVARALFAADETPNLASAR